MILGKYGNPSAILRMNDMDKASLPNASTLPLQVSADYPVHHGLRAEGAPQFSCPPRDTRPTGATTPAPRARPPRASVPSSGRARRALYLLAPWRAARYLCGYVIVKSGHAAREG
jgi:hypothetical protein